MGRTSVGRVGMAVRTEWLRASDGAGMAVEIHGSLPDDGTPVVLLHGLSQQRHFWGPVISRLRHRPVLVLDQRGHGDSDAGVDADFTIPRVAADVVEALDAVRADRAHVIGHSWGAAVAIAIAARHPQRVMSVGLIDGGLWARDPGADREAELERLRPPALGLPADDLWAMVSGGQLAPWWSEEIRRALEPTFTADASGLLRTRIGVERHMAVLRAMLDYDPWPDAAHITCPAWHVRCLSEATARRDIIDPALDRARARTALETSILMQEWEGAIHDVPLQWPALVAGFIDALIESAQGKEAR